MKQKRNRNKKNLLDIMVEKANRYFGVMIVVYVAVVVIIPILVCIIKSLLMHKIVMDISTDGLLSYFISAVCGLLTLVLSMIAVLQSEKIAQMEDERAIETRRSEVLPHIHVHLKRKDEDVFELTVHNYGENTATDMYLFEYMFFPYIRGHESVAKEISYNVEKNAFSVADPSFLKLNAEGYPSYIQLIYKDMDQNMISQEFRYISDAEYESQQAEYI